ncbi:MAG: DUF2071 domain-containing protein [Gemmatimonadales bacterium]
MPRPFLTARWSDLVFLTFEAPEDLVSAATPRGAEPDRWQGRTHVTLVALRMDDVRVAGWRIPGFGGHAQVNLRTYVRGDGVSFIRQLVPSRLIAAVARIRYREPFRAAAIEARVRATNDARHVEYRFGLARPVHRIAVAGSHAAERPVPGTFAHYLIERRFGWRADRRGRPRSFRVARDAWAVREVRTVEYAIDFGALYGAPWACLNDRPPASTILAVGSAVAVY